MRLTGETKVGDGGVDDDVWRYDRVKEVEIDEGRN